MAQRQGSGPVTRSVGSLPEGPGSMLTGLVGGKRGSGQGKRKEEDAKVRPLPFTCFAGQAVSGCAQAAHLNPQPANTASASIAQAFQAGAGSKKGRSAFIDITNIGSSKAVYPPEKVRADL